MYERRSIPRTLRFAAALLLVAFAGFALADPPTRVARVGYLSGNVSFQPAGDDRWAEVPLNRPLVTGDRLYADRDSRAELEIGSAAIRLDAQSTFSVLALDDEIAQLELTEGVMNVSVRYIGTGQTYEIDTPTLAFVIDRPGDYRIDIAPQGDSTMVTVFEGSGDVYGENNASYSVRSGNSYRFYDSSLRDYEILDLPRPDDFDRWVSSRNARAERSVSRRYVSEGTIGYADLDEYGSWDTVAEYGQVWYPSRVSVGWAPYRYGHWSWIDPWGWTWVDNAAWGFAPFHYGRWAYIGNRWGWCPGARNVRAVYAPAMVAFVGGGGWGASIRVGGGPVGWFPLGPRDVYVPWYRASRGYFTNVNVRNTTVVNVTNVTNIYNNYSQGRPIRNVNYAYQRNVAAVTAVPREAFVSARPVNAARVRVNEAQLRSAQVVDRMAVAPTRASLVPANSVRTRAVAPKAALDRRVIARTAPPPRPVSTERRLQAIERNKGQPLAREQLREIATQRPAAARAERAERVQVVGRKDAAKPQPLPARGANAQRGGATPATRGAPANRNAPATRGAPPASRNEPAARGAPATRGAPAERRDATPPARGNARTTPADRDKAAPRATPAQRGESPSRGAEASQRGALPSSRFAPRGGRGNEAGERGKAAPAPARGADTRSAPRSAPARQAEDRRGSTPERRGTPSRDYAPQRSAPARSAAPQRSEPSPRQAPQSRSAPRPAERSAPRPAERAMPQRSEPRSAPAPRSAPQRSERQERSAPARSAPQRSAAPPRSAPEPRSAPPQRSAPQQRPVPERTARQPREQQQPQSRQRGSDKRDEKDDGRPGR